MKKYLSLQISLSSLIPASLLTLVLTLVLTPVPAGAALKSHYLDSLQKNFYVEACKAKLGDAVKDPGCKPAKRLYEFVDWLDSVGRGAPHDSVLGNALKSHYESLTGKNRYAADIRGWPLVGEASSPLTVVMYFSGTCPLCKKNFVELHREVTAGKLKGKVRIVAKPFGANSVNKALLAAHDMGRFTDIMLALARVEGRIDEETVYEIARTMYFDKDKFKSAAESQAVAARIQAAHAEGNKNGVELVPTYFVGGRRYESVSNTWWILDTFDYFYEVDGLGVGGKK